MGRTGVAQNKTMYYIITWIRLFFGAHLLFSALASADSHLLFVCERHINPPPPDGEPVVVPVRRVYFVINNVTLYRASDGAPVPVNAPNRPLPAPREPIPAAAPPTVTPSDQVALLQ